MRPLDDDLDPIGWTHAAADPTAGGEWIVARCGLIILRREAVRNPTCPRCRAQKE